MEVFVLGQLRAVVGGREVEISRPLARALLAMLTMHAGTDISRDQLIEHLVTIGHMDPR